MSIYVKLVCEALTDAKLLAAGPGGFWIWARGLLYAKQHLTDGVVPDDAMPLVAFGIADPQVEINKLVTLKLWETCDGGHRVPEKTWLKYHSPAAVVREVSEARSKAGRQGGRPKKQNESNLVSEESNLHDLESKSARTPKPRAQSTEHRAQSSKHRAQSTDTEPADADNLYDQPSDDPDSHLGETKPKNAYTASFERWYACYPLKAAKQAAAAAFGRALTRITSARGGTRDSALTWLCGVTEAFAASPKGTGEYIPHPSTWLNDGRYEDDPSAWNNSGKRRPAGPDRVGPGQRYSGPDENA